jgi:hypothetical protein
MPSKKSSNPPAPLKRVATLDHLRGKKPVEAEVPILLEDVAAPESPPEGLEGHDAQEWQNYEKLLAENTVVMRFRSVGRKVFDELVNACPPTEKQIAEAKENKEPIPNWDAETFTPTLIQASCIEPELTDAAIKEIFDEWNQGELMKLWTVALAVNTTERTGVLGKGFGGIRG